MDERRPHAPAAQTEAPQFKTASSALAVVGGGGSASDAPAGFTVSERREGGVYALSSQRSARSFALQMVLPVLLLLWTLAWSSVCVRLILTGEPGGAFALLLFFVLPLLPFVHWGLRRAFDSARVAVDSRGVRVEGGLATAFDVGVRDVPMDEIFGFAAQHEGSSWTRVVVLTRDGEAKLLRCNVLDRAHAIFVVTRLNRELAAIRDAAHYRK